MSKLFDEEEIDQICEAGVYAAKKTLLHIIGQVEGDAESALEANWKGVRHKRCLSIDSAAEAECKKFLMKKLGSRFGNITFYGEERLRSKSLDLTSTKGICILADAVDGTDLLERDLSNWCCDFAVFVPTAPKGNKLVASFVALPSGDVYYARCDKEFGFVHRHQAKSDGPVAGPSRMKSIGNASICFYGQKIENLAKTVNSKFIVKLQKTIKAHAKKNEVTFRIYTLAGVPMVMKLVDHRVKTALGIDAVFDICGQQPHDLVPGAFIALKSGATVLKLDGEKPLSKMTIQDLEQLLLRPAANTSKYVIAATMPLAKEIGTLLLSSQSQ